MLGSLQKPMKLVNGKIQGETNISWRNLLKKKDHKILIGDSHARDCTEKLSNYLGNSYEVTGYVNPSTGLEVITNSAKKGFNT